MNKFSPKLTKLGEYWCTKRLKNQASWNPYPEDQSWGATSWSCWQWYHCPHWRHQQADQQCSRPGLWQAFPVFHWGRKSPSMGSLYWCRPCAILWLHPGKEDIYKRITACNWMPSYACKIILYLIYIHFFIQYFFHTHREKTLWQYKDMLATFLHNEMRNCLTPIRHDMSTLLN